MQEENAEDYYTPPIPVPISHQVIRDYTINRGLRSPVYLVNPTTTITSVAGAFGTVQGRGTILDEGLDFRINTIMVDNFTVAWMYWPIVGVFVPPFTFGKVFRGDGSKRARAIFENPPGLAAPVTPTAAQKVQVARIVYFEELLPESPGLGVPAGNQ